jgi:hypothetical protein
MTKKYPGPSQASMKPDNATDVARGDASCAAGLGVPESRWNARLPYTRLPRGHLERQCPG